MPKESSARYCQKNWEKIQERARKRYQDHTEDEKEILQKHVHLQYKNFPEDGKQRFIEYRKKYYEIWKKKKASFIWYFLFWLTTVRK